LFLPFNRLSMVNIGLNGYGRIGRIVHRLLLQKASPLVRVAAINARSEDTAMRAHLLKYDSLHGPLNKRVEAGEKFLRIEGETIACLAVKDARDIPWRDHDVALVLECTGKARDHAMASKHLEAGAARVLVTAPMKDDTATFVRGVNEDAMKPEHTVVSNASCTTNCIAPTLKLVHAEWGILNASVSSIHSFTHSQNLLDNSGTDLRRARSAVQSVIPTTTGAVRATAQIIPELAGKLDGMAYRVPIATSSVCDMVIHTQKPLTAQAVNEFFRQKARDSYYDPILDVCDEPLVSIDFKTNPHSSILDTELTQVVGGHYLKLIAWYDNEWGYANRLVEMLESMAAQMS